MAGQAQHGSKCMLCGSDYYQVARAARPCRSVIQPTAAVSYIYTKMNGHEIAFSSVRLAYGSVCDQGEDEM